jgi:hypothetical protein
MKIMKIIAISILASTLVFFASPIISIGMLYRFIAQSFVLGVDIYDDAIDFLHNSLPKE